MYQFYIVLFWHKKHLRSNSVQLKWLSKKVVTIPTGVQIPLSDMFPLNELNVDYLYIIYSRVVNMALCPEQSRVYPEYHLWNERNHPGGSLPNMLP